MKTKEIIDELNKALEDEGYRDTWRANIAISYIDCERSYRIENNKVGKYLNYKDRHTIANESAKHFLYLLWGGLDERIN